MKVKHNIKIVRQDGDIEYHDVEGEWNEEGSGGPSFKPLYELLNCKMLEVTYGMNLQDTKELPIFLDEEGLYKENNQINGYATAMQKRWCDATGRMQISPIVGDVAIDLGLTVESLTEVSTELELQDRERKDNTTQA
ncbi:hypothetical protein [uncultured Mediterranean phage uvMED]|nr:hypothetical protein [uncultured Mediterranean phage uvMED]